MTIDDKIEDLFMSFPRKLPSDDEIDRLVRYSIGQIGINEDNTERAKTILNYVESDRYANYIANAMRNEKRRKIIKDIIILLGPSNVMIEELEDKIEKGELREDIKDIFLGWGSNKTTMNYLCKLVTSENPELSDYATEIIIELGKSCLSNMKGTLYFKSYPHKFDAVVNCIKSGKPYQSQQANP